MPEKKVIAVLGATGAQGGGLVQTMLNDPSGGFAARILTRDTSSAKAKELASLGAEVVEADADNAESLKNAFHGAYGAYLRHILLGAFSPETEQTRVTNMAHAAKQANVQHVIWSTLEDTRNWVPLTDRGLPTTFLLTSLPTGITSSISAWGRRGDWTASWPSRFPWVKKLPGIATEDIGRCAYGIYKAGREYIGRKVGIAGGHLTGDQMTAALTKGLGQDVAYNDVPPEVYRSLDFPGAEALGNMFQFKRDFEEYYCGVRNFDESRALNPSLQTLDEWLEKNKSRIPLD